MKNDEARIVSVDQLPEDPLKMPPPHWRGGGAIFHLERSLWEIEDLLKELLPIHAQTRIRLDEYYAKYPDDDKSNEALTEFGEIVDELFDIEHQIRLKGEIACLMSAIEAEDDINRFCVFNFHKDIAESIERIPPPEKLLVASATIGKPGAKDTSVFSGLCQMVAWRNAFAHGHCVDRPTKTLRHNHLIQPNEYPGVPSTLAETRELVGAFLRLSDYLHEISLNAYTGAKEGNVENVRDSIRKIACYRFDGNNWAYDVMLTGTEQTRIMRVLSSIVRKGDSDKLVRLESVLATLEPERARIVRLELGLEGTPQNSGQVRKTLGLRARQFERERAIALAQLAGVADLIEEGAV